MNYRAIVGFLVAATIPTIALTLLSPITGGDLTVALGLVPILLFFSGAATVLVGGPVFLLLNQFGLVRWWSVAISGIVIGAIVAIVVRAPNIAQISDFLVMVPIGGLSPLDLLADLEAATCRLTAALRATLSRASRGHVSVHDADLPLGA